MIRASFASHFYELRKRLVVSFACLVIVFVALYSVKETLLNLLIHPVLAVLPAGHTLVYTSVGELFFTYLKICALGAFVLCLPMFIWQLWLFAKPGLYAHERRSFWPYLVVVPGLFYAGALFAFYLIVPIALKFFLGFVEEGVYPLPTVKEYLGFVLNMLLAFGLSFELPVILVLAMQTGLLKVESLVQNRRIAIVGVFVVAAVITPPDPLSQTMLALPMLVLYELAIVVGKKIKHRN